MPLLYATLCLIFQVIAKLTILVVNLIKNNLYHRPITENRKKRLLLCVNTHGDDNLCLRFFFTLHSEQCLVSTHGFKANYRHRKWENAYKVAEIIKIPSEV